MKRTTSLALTLTRNPNPNPDPDPNPNQALKRITSDDKDILWEGVQARNEDLPLPLPLTPTPKPKPKPSGVRQLRSTHTHALDACDDTFYLSAN